MPYDIGGGGPPAQAELGSTWQSLASWCHTKAAEFGDIPVLGGLLAGAFNGLGDGFSQAHTLSVTMAMAFSQVSATLDGLANGSILSELLDQHLPGWRDISQDPTGWVAAHLGVNAEYLAILGSTTLEDTAQRIGDAFRWVVSGIAEPYETLIDDLMEGKQELYWIVSDPARWFSELVANHFPGLSQFMVGNESWYIDWSYEIAQGLMALPETLRRELGQALFGILGLDLAEGEDLILALISRALQWIDEHKPDFKTLAYTILGKIIRYFLEGTV